MADRPRKLPMPAQLLVWGSRRLAMTEKAVWYHTWFLDQDNVDGAYLSATAFGARLGVSPRTIEDARAHLGRLQLLTSWTRPEGRERGYRATLPAGLFVPHTFREATPELVGILDEHLAAMETGVVRPTPYPAYGGARTQPTAGPVGNGVPQAGGAAVVEGGRGEAASSSFSAQQSAPSSRTDAEDTGGRSVRVREREERGAGTRGREPGGAPRPLRELLDPTTNAMLDDLRRAAGGEG